MSKQSLNASDRLKVLQWLSLTEEERTTIPPKECDELAKLLAQLCPNPQTAYYNYIATVITQSRQLYTSQSTTSDGKAGDGASRDKDIWSRALDAMLDQDRIKADLSSQQSSTTTKTHTLTRDFGVRPIIAAQNPLPRKRRSLEKLSNASIVRSQLREVQKRNVRELLRVPGPGEVKAEMRDKDSRMVG